MAQMEEYDQEEWDDMKERFADPGGRSALHASSKRNPRNLPCPRCGTSNVLTKTDKQSGYICDECADGVD